MKTKVSSFSVKISQEECVSGKILFNILYNFTDETGLNFRRLKRTNDRKEVPTIINSMIHNYKVNCVYHKSDKYNHLYR